MNSTRTNLINKICAILAIFALTVSDFVFVGQSAVSYAIDVVKTNHANVEFSAYFQDENGEKIQRIEENIDKEAYLYVDVSVKNEGYFDGEIKVADGNFNVKSDEISDGVSEIKDNVVKLKQINAGSTSKIKLAIEAKKENSINASTLDGKTKIELNGQYINSKNVEKNKYIEISGNDEVEVKWKSSDDSKIELDGRLLTNSIYEIEGENKRLVQMVVNSKVANNSYPVKTTELSLNVPEKVENVKVTARSVKGTNNQAEFGESNYEYKKEEKKLTIKVSNENTDQISWEKDAVDTFVVTYVLNPSENIANEDIQIDDKITLHDGKELTDSKNVHIEEEIDGVISSTIESSENEIYKGKIYTGEERDYTEINKINVDYIESEDKIEIEQKAATYLEGENEKDANILYKETKINKDEFLKIFGENGYITIKSSEGTVISNINKDTEANEEGKIVVTYPDGQKELKIETSKPENIGTLNIENTRAIIDAGYGRDEIKNIVGIKERVTTNTKVAEKIITLKETETVGNMSVDVEKISTVANSQTITVDATLDASDESKDLYKNPTVTIKLPKEMTLIKARYAALYKNGLEVESAKTSKTSNGESQISVKFKGEQQKYDVAGGTKVSFKLEVSTDKLTPSKKSQIEMIYSNENKNEEKTSNTEISFESQYGIMIYNQIVNYNDGNSIVTVDKETAYGELSTNAPEKEMVINTALINNYGENVTDVTLIGQIPANQDEESYVAKLNELKTNNEKLKIYYSNKKDAKAEDESWGEYKEDAVCYKVVVDEMEKEEVLKLNVPVTIPENIKYNKKGTFSSVVTADYKGNIESNTSNIILATKTSMAESSKEREVSNETETGFNTKISASVGNDSLSENDNIYEGQTIRYKVTLINNTGKDYTNVTVKANQKNGYVWNNVEKEGTNPYYGTTTREHFYEISDSNDITLGKIESLKNGESYTYEYEASVYTLNNEKIDGNKTFGTITAISDDKSLNETISTIKNNIKNAELQVNILNGSSNEIELPSGSAIKSVLSIKNLTNQALTDMDVKVAYSKGLESSVKIIEEYEGNVLYEGKETNSDGITIMTLKIKSIGANETINLEMFPATEYDLGNEKSLDVWILGEVITSEKNSYISNKFEKTVKDYTPNIELAQQGNFEDGKTIDVKVDKINDGEKIGFKATITNHEENEYTVQIEYLLDKMIDVQSAKIQSQSGEEDVLNQITYNDLKKDTQTIKPGETVTLNLEGVVDAVETESITNNLKVIDNVSGRIIKNSQTFSVNKGEDIDEPDEDNNDNNNNGDNNNGDNNNNQNNNNGNNSNSGNNQDNDQNEGITYTVSGKAWIDNDKDGIRNSTDEPKGEIEVTAMDAETGKIVGNTKTSADGTYSLQLPKGKYMIIFKYDSNLYTTTVYQAENANQTENSDALERKVSIDGNTITAGATDTFMLEENISNLDIGLVLRSSFDLKLQKYVSKITINNDTKTQNYEQKDNTTLAKAEIKSKNLNGSLVVIEYKIKVTNVGEVAGYARNIVDYMPATLNFNSSLNSDWYISGNNLYNTSLANTKIEPGETKELTLVLTKTMTESNTGLVNNKAEIAESSNELGIKDETNEKGSADVIISVSTGALVNYVATTVITLIILAGLAYLVNKKYLSKKI